MSCTPPRYPLMVFGLLALSGISGLALASDDETPATDESVESTDASDATDATDATDTPPPEPHWSGLPIWGVEAEARGYDIPLPFGIGLTGYSAEQPVNIKDLQLGIGGEPPVSVTGVLQIDRVDTTQQNESVKFDVLVFPFLDVYVVAGHTKGTTEGVIEVVADPVLDPLLPAQLQLDASFSGPTYGAGVTLQGGSQIRDWRELTAVVVIDWNRTRTDLSFDNEALIAETKPEASVFSARFGLHGRVTDSTDGAIWAGAMHQKVQQQVAGNVSDTDIQFIVMQSAAHPWNTLLGGMLEFGEHGYLLVEGGFGERESILLAGIYKF